MPSIKCTKRLQTGPLEFHKNLVGTSLALIGIRQGTFYPLYFLDQIFIKNFLAFFEMKIDLASIGLICHPAKLIEL